MRDPDLGFLPSEEVNGEVNQTMITARQVKFNLSLTFKANAILGFRLESQVDQNRFIEVEATYETY